MKADSIRDYNFESILSFPPVNFTEALAQSLAVKMQKALGIPGLAINFPGEGEVVFEKIHGREEKTRVSFSQEKIRIQHANAATFNFDWYKRQVEDIAKTASEILKFPFIYEQTHSISKLCPMDRNADSREFLAEKVCRLKQEEIGIFKRPALGFGFRIVFPATGPEECEFDVRIESFLRDPTMIFIFNKGRFVFPPVGKDVGKISQSLSQVEAFISDKILGFLGSFTE